jgi:hypothetical protein
MRPRNVCFWRWSQPVGATRPIADTIGETAARRSFSFALARILRRWKLGVCECSEARQFEEAVYESEPN